jgi:hypothetical protein
VRDALRYVNVRDLATGGEHVQELADVYVDAALVSPAADHGSRGLPDGSAAAETAELLSFSELLDRQSSALLVLAGQPGSGKSTILAYAAWRSAAPTLRGHLGLGRVRVRTPVLLALREHAESIIAHPAISLPAVIRQAVGTGPGKEPSRWWERQLRRGRCLILLDGMDEIADAGDRRTVAGWIERETVAYRGNRFVVAARPYGLPEALTARADVFVIRPFTTGQIQLFLDRWYVAAERHSTGAADRSARRAADRRGRESAARLAAAARQHQALQDLAANPLLLTMIASAHRYRGALPGSRADLYGEMCQVLLSRRVQAKDLPEILSWQARQALLATLAYQMMRDRISAVGGERVLEILEPQLARFSLSVSDQAFLDDIARNGPLAETEDGRYSFTHLTFQEYLAARHVSTSPGLVRSLTDNVSDPWWHETIRLYAATADASPIVRACLDHGTIPALTLAFDCSAANAEIDPELRQRLDRERRRAYEPDCSAAHRRLIAGVEAARLLRDTLTTTAGTRICVRPVPAELYWLFLADTRAPRPDSPCEADSAEPATGIWGAEARAFVTWLNSITAIGAGTEVRLPRQAELDEEPVASALRRYVPVPVSAAWTQGNPELWHGSGQPHPHELTGAALCGALAADARQTALLPQVLTAAVLGVALDITRDLADISALTSALARDVTARANSGGELVDLMHAHAHAIVLTYTHALDLARAPAIEYTCAAGPELIQALDLTRGRALADAVSHGLAGAIDLARTRAVELAAAIDLDLKVLSAFEFDIAHVVELAGVHAASLDRACALAHSLKRSAEFDPASVFGGASLTALDLAFPVPGVLGLPLRWVGNSPLASTLLAVLASPASAPASPNGAPPPGDPYLLFAQWLAARAGITEATRLRADLGRPLTDALRNLVGTASAGPGSAGPGSARTGSAGTGGALGWSRAEALSRLADACAPLSGRHEFPDPPTAAALSAVALTLAHGATASEPDAAGVLRAVAATVTLLEARAKGEAPAGESIILALGRR